jgi:polyisoprenyl-phosphate glycosyltransferase
VISFLCGMNMLMTGIIGLYIGRIHAEVKRRPLYVVDKRTGFDRSLAPEEKTEEDRKRMSAA